MKNLKMIMDEQNVSGYELAKRTGISSSHVSDIVLDKKQPTVMIAKKIADALGVSLDDLVGDKPKKLPKTG